MLGIPMDDVCTIKRSKTMEAMTLRKVVEVTETPIRATNGLSSY